MIKGIVKFTLFFLAAGAFAVFTDQVLWPCFAERSLFLKYKLEQNPIYLTQKVQTVIQENKALKDAIEKSAKTVVAIKTTTAKGTVTEEPGLIVTSDGMIVALSDRVPANSTTEITVDGQKVGFQILKRDKDLNLALIKADKNNLPTASFYALENLKLGERVFFYGSVAGKNFANEGVVRSFNQDVIETSIIDLPEAAGSPVFDIEGNILGLATVAKDGRVSVVPVSKIKSFSGL